MLGNFTRATPLVPQDKACLDQGNIQQALACLPVFLAGCQTLLVVAGPTYCSRLWCVMERFAFVRSDCLLSSNPDNVVPGPHRIALTPRNRCPRVRQWAAPRNVWRST